MVHQRAVPPTQAGQLRWLRMSVSVYGKGQPAAERTMGPCDQEHGP